MTARVRGWRGGLRRAGASAPGGGTRLLAWLLVLGGWAPLATAAPVPQLTRIADTNTTIPGGGGAAFNDFEAPVIEDSIVAFWSWDGIGLVEGVYYGNDAASVQALVDRSTQIPGRPETFGIIAGINNGGGPSIDGRQACTVRKVAATSNGRRPALAKAACRGCTTKGME